MITRLLSRTTATAAAPLAATRGASYGNSLSVQVTDAGVAVVTIDQPDSKVNSLGEDMVNAFPGMFNDLSANTDVKSILLRSAKKGCFVAGADIDMLNKVSTREEALAISTNGQAIFAQIESSDKPVIAALNGATLGGGLELALACHFRIALDIKATKVGLPEVMLGLLPGAGGTQRLPALIGIDKAMPLILQGKQLDAKRASRQGIVNQVVSPLGPGIVSTEEYFDTVAMGVAEDFASGKQQKPKAKAPKMPTKIVNAVTSFGPTRDYFFDSQVVAPIMKMSAGVYPAPLKIASVLRETMANGGPGKGYNAEAEGFADLVMTPESKACIHLFHGQNHCKKNKYGKPAKAVETIGVLGAGLMGAGISAVSVNKNYNVLLRDMNDKGLARGFNQVNDIYQRKVSRKALSKMQKHGIMNKLSLQTDYAGFDRADMVIEAVFEDMAVKHAVVKEVEQHTPDHCIIATNTSALSITEIAKASKRPENIVGMHYFSPVDKMMLLEIIPGEKTSDNTLAAASAVGIKQGKLCVVVKECAGFFANRCLGPALSELTLIMQEGTTPDALNKLATDYGFPVGLASLLDEVGIDVGHTVGKYLQGAYGDRLKGGDPAMFDEFLAAGLVGKKTKKGIFNYEGKKNKRAGVNQEAQAILEKFKVTAPAEFTKEDHQHRIALRFVNEAVMTLEEGVIQSATDGDIAAVFGVGFPARFGGPFKFVDTKGADWVVAEMERFEALYGAAFTPCKMLKDMAASGKKFY